MGGGCQSDTKSSTVINSEQTGRHHMVQSTPEDLHVVSGRRETGICVSSIVK